MSERHPLVYNEFDIETARKAGKSSEQERIIKLLETEFCEPEFKGDSFTPADNLLVNLGLAIELIKGETK